MTVVDVLHLDHLAEPRDGKERAAHKHKKTVNFGYRYSIVMGCGEFSPGRRVSDVERMKQFESRQTWLQESQRLGYGGDQNEESMEGLQMPFRDETADAPVTTRRRSRSDYNAKVFEESGQEKMYWMSLSVHWCRG